MTAAEQEASSRPPANFKSDSASATVENNQPSGEPQTAKKKNKKKKKKSASSTACQPDTSRSTLKISRAKHWKYISSYHGQWLQLPNELLQTLLQINCGDRPGDDYESHSGEDQRNAAGQLLPPPLDTAVFRGILEVRSLVESASDLAIRAASGLSAAARGAFGSPSDLRNDPLFGGNCGGPRGGMNGGGDGGGRATPMSATSQARLRTLAVSKLAQAYRIDEVAACVAVMQGSTALDDLAERVLRQEPSHADARYVQFFHEKIPSRTLAQSTNASALDGLIAQFPEQLAYYRTKGVVFSFQHRFAEAIDTFSRALVVARSQRKASSTVTCSRSRKGGKGNQFLRSSSKASEGGAARHTEKPPHLWSRPAIDEATHIGLKPGDDCERQLWFHRGMAYFNWACNVLEDAVLRLEGAPRPKAGGLLNEGGEATLEGLGINNAQATGLLGSSRPKVSSRWPRYEAALNEPALRDQVFALLQRSAKDHERFLSYFPIFQPESGSALSSAEKRHKLNSSSRSRKEDKLSPHARRMVQYRSLEGRTRCSHPQADLRQSDTTLLTTYHPLLVESHFTLLLCNLLTGQYQTAVKQHYQLATLMAGLEGFPVFLPARSMSQTQYSELLERIAVTWLKEREDQGIAAPEGNEDQIAEQGPLESLHHLASFFTPEHGALLAASAEEQEREKFGCAGASSGKTPLSVTATQKPKAKEGAHSSNPDADLKNLTLARAEVSAAWMQTVVLKDRVTATSSFHTSQTESAYSGVAGASSSATAA